MLSIPRGQFTKVVSISLSKELYLYLGLVQRLIRSHLFIFIMQYFFETLKYHIASNSNFEGSFSDYSKKGNVQKLSCENLGNIVLQLTKILFIQLRNTKKLMQKFQTNCEMFF